MKVKIEVDKGQFQGVVNSLESKQTFANLSQLWTAVENTEWAKSHKPRSLTASVCYARAKELGIITKTQPGRKPGDGPLSQEQKDAMRAGQKNRKPRSEKMKVYSDTFDFLRKDAPPRFLPLVEQAAKGSLKAALKLQCLYCTCFQPVEIKKCTCPGCPLFPHRPYQKTLEVENEEVEETHEEEEVEEEVT